MKAWRETGSEAIDGSDAAHEFEALCTAWGAADVLASPWRLDWAGKEVLKYLRMLLAARFGWYDDRQKRPPVDWKQVGGRAKQDALDRPMERRIGHELVPALIAWLRADGQDDDRDEWADLAAVCRGGARRLSRLAPVGRPRRSRPPAAPIRRFRLPASTEPRR